MARYEHLPIYKAALDMTVHFEKLVAGFSRYHKYTLGTELREGSRAVLQQVLRANNAKDCGGELKIIAAILKAPVIEKILTHLGLQARAPPRAPARGQALQAA